MNEKPNIAMNVNVTYPNNPDYDMEVKLEKINLDKERQKLIATLCIQKNGKRYWKTYIFNENNICSL